MTYNSRDMQQQEGQLTYRAGGEGSLGYTTAIGGSLQQQQLQASSSEDRVGATASPAGIAHPAAAGADATYGAYRAATSPGVYSESGGGPSPDNIEDDENAYVESTFPPDEIPLGGSIAAGETVRRSTAGGGIGGIGGSAVRGSGSLGMTVGSRTVAFTAQHQPSSNNNKYDGADDTDGFVVNRRLLHSATRASGSLGATSVSPSATQAVVVSPAAVGATPTYGGSGASLFQRSPQQLAPFAGYSSLGASAAAVAESSPTGPMPAAMFQQQQQEQTRQSASQPQQQASGASPQALPSPPQLMPSPAAFRPQSQDAASAQQPPRQSSANFEPAARRRPAPQASSATPPSPPQAILMCRQLVEGFMACGYPSPPAALIEALSDSASVSWSSPSDVRGAVIGTHMWLRSMLLLQLPPAQQLQPSPSLLPLPDSLRPLAWRLCLRLPCSSAAFSRLTDLGPHPGWDGLSVTYPLHDQPALAACLQAVMSALGHWAPVTSELAFMPLAAFPFVKLFHSALSGSSVHDGSSSPALLAFEATAAFLLNWGGHWLETLPLPPVPLLARCHILLSFWDPPLAQHLEACGADPTFYAWPPLRAALSEVLPRQLWAGLWDHLVLHCHDPSLLVYALVAVLTQPGVRSTLLAIRPSPADAGSVMPLTSLAMMLQQPQQQTVDGTPQPSSTDIELSVRATPSALAVMAALRRPHRMDLTSLLTSMYRMRRDTPAWAHPLPVNDAVATAASNSNEEIAAATAAMLQPPPPIDCTDISLLAEAASAVAHSASSTLGSTRPSVRFSGLGIASAYDAPAAVMMAPAYTGPLHPLPDSSSSSGGSSSYHTITAFPVQLVQSRFAQRQKAAGEAATRQSLQQLEAAVQARAAAAVAQLQAQERAIVQRIEEHSRRLASLQEQQHSMAAAPPSVQLSSAYSTPSRYGIGNAASAARTLAALHAQAQANSSAITGSSDLGAGFEGQVEALQRRLSVLASLQQAAAQLDIGSSPVLAQPSSAAAAVAPAASASAAAAQLQELQSRLAQIQQVEAAVEAAAVRAQQAAAAAEAAALSAQASVAGGVSTAPHSRRGSVGATSAAAAPGPQLQQPFVGSASFAHTAILPTQSYNLSGSTRGEFAHANESMQHHHSPVLSASRGGSTGGGSGRGDAMILSPEQRAVSSPQLHPGYYSSSNVLSPGAVAVQAASSVLQSPPQQQQRYQQNPSYSPSQLQKRQLQSTAQYYNQWQQSYDDADVTRDLTEQVLLTSRSDDSNITASSLQLAQLRGLIQPQQRQEEEEQATSAAPFQSPHGIGSSTEGADAVELGPSPSPAKQSDATYSSARQYAASAASELVQRTAQQLRRELTSSSSSSSPRRSLQFPSSSSSADQHQQQPSSKYYAPDNAALDQGQEEEEKRAVADVEIDHDADIVGSDGDFAYAMDISGVGPLPSQRGEQGDEDQQVQAQVEQQQQQQQEEQLQFYYDHDNEVGDSGAASAGDEGGGGNSPATPLLRGPRSATSSIDFIDSRPGSSGSDAQSPAARMNNSTGPAGAVAASGGDGSGQYLRPTAATASAATYNDDAYGATADSGQNVDDDDDDDDDVDGDDGLMMLTPQRPVVAAASASATGGANAYAPIPFTPISPPSPGTVLRNNRPSLTTAGRYDHDGDGSYSSQSQRQLQQLLTSPPSPLLGSSVLLESENNSNNGGKQEQEGDIVRSRFSLNALGGYEGSAASPLPVLPKEASPPPSYGGGGSSRASRGSQQARPSAVQLGYSPASSSSQSPQPPPRLGYSPSRSSYASASAAAPGSGLIARTSNSSSSTNGVTTPSLGSRARGVVSPSAAYELGSPTLPSPPSQPPSGAAQSISGFSDSAVLLSRSGGGSGGSGQEAYRDGTGGGGGVLEENVDEHNAYGGAYGDDVYGDDGYDSSSASSLSQGPL